jgi:hypothetical protein
MIHADRLEDYLFNKILILHARQFCNGEIQCLLEIGLIHSRLILNVGQLPQEPILEKNDFPAVL